MQGGDPNVTSESVHVGDKVATVLSPLDGYIQEISNKRMVIVCRLAGAPHDKGAGIMIHKKKGEYVKKGDGLFTIYADKEWKLDTRSKSRCASRSCTSRAWSGEDSGRVARRAGPSPFHTIPVAVKDTVWDNKPPYVWLSLLDSTVPSYL